MYVTSTTFPLMVEGEREYNLTKHIPGNTYHYYGLAAVVPFCLVIVVFIILSVVGNIMVIITVARHKGMRTRTNMFIVNLAVADMLTAVIDMPISLVTLIHGDWILGDFFCQLNGFTMALFFICSIHTLMYISIHKYISITRPFRQVMSHQKVLLMIGAAWCWAALCATFPLLGWNKTIYKKGSSQCGPSLPDDWKDFSHSILITVSNYIVPLVVMIFCYSGIFKEIDNHMHRIRETSNIPLQDTIHQQRRISVTLFLVLSCFLICWTPYVVYSSTVAFIKDKRLVPLVVNPVAYWCGYLNSACNPVIYGFKNHSFRQGYKEIMCVQSSVPPSEGGTRPQQDPSPSQPITREEGLKFSQISLMGFTLPSRRRDCHSNRPSRIRRTFHEVTVRKNKVVSDFRVEDGDLLRSSLPLNPLIEEKQEESIDTG